VFDLVPHGRARRKVRNSDRESGSIGEALEFNLPQARAGPVASTMFSTFCRSPIFMP
jgi:hypothetical protein